jgi:hypothetical protein
MSRLRFLLNALTTTTLRLLATRFLASSADEEFFPADGFSRVAFLPWFREE